MHRAGSIRSFGFSCCFDLDHKQFVAIRKRLAPPGRVGMASRQLRNAFTNDPSYRFLVDSSRCRDGSEGPARCLKPD